jgi:hypothetical protein
MKKSYRIISAIALLLLPIAIRLVWLNVFPFSYEPNVTVPSFEQAVVPEPPTASAPIKTAQSKEAPGQVVLIDYAHNNQLFINEIEPFTRALTTRGAITEIYTGENYDLENRLKYASAYVIMSPLNIFSSEEIRLVEQFVASGGRLLVFTDPTRGFAFFDFTFPDIDSANLLLSPHGIAFSGDYMYNLSDNEGNFRNVKFSQFGKHPLTENLGMVVLYGAHSVATSSGTALLKASSRTVSSLTDSGGDLAGMVISANGSVLATGDFTFMTTPFFNVADNALLVEQVAEFSLGGERKPGLANFPYLFKGDVTLVPLGKTQLTANLLYRAALLQDALRQSNVKLEIGESKSAANNILIGTYEESEDILAILDARGITVGDTQEYVTVPGIGKVGLIGTGAMFFETGKNGNTLIILADSSDNLDIMLALFYLGDTTGCVIQADMGICSLGEGGSFDDGKYNSDDEYYSGEYEEEPEAETEPEATATPAG